MASGGMLQIHVDKGGKSNSMKWTNEHINDNEIKFSFIVIQALYS